MGITYKARDTTLLRTVALKVLNNARLGSESAQERFLREARAAAALRHENIASVYYLGKAHERYFYTMEFIDGETVDAYVKRKGPLDPIQALKIARQVASALVAAEKEQLVHRDLKPSNLMIPFEEEGQQVIKVIDFGLARNLKADGEDPCMLTKPGEFVGTPQFASPEQLEDREVDIRSDIYSLGVTLYFMLTGEPPFSGSTGQIASQHLCRPLPTELLAKAPECVVKLIQLMTKKDRNERPQTLRDLEKQITACLESLRSPADNTVNMAGDSHNPTQNGNLSSDSERGTVFLDTYRLVKELDELPEGRRFLAEDIRQKHEVRLLVLNPHFLLDTTRLAALELAVDQVRKAPYPTLRAIFGLERTVDCTALVEEYVHGPTLRDVLRRRSLLGAPEVARLLTHLAPLADHAQGSGLRHVDLTLSGIQLSVPEVDPSETQSALLLRPITAWEPLRVKVNGIAFSAFVANTNGWSGSMTLIADSPDEGPRGSYLRLLSLLGYELLGGPQVKLETTGRFTPLAALCEEGNAVLRRGIVEEFSSAVEMASELAACVGAAGRAVSQAPTVSSRQLDSAPPSTTAVQNDVETPTPAHVNEKRKILQAKGWKLPVVLIASCGLGWCLSYYAMMGKRPPGGGTTEKKQTVVEQSTVQEKPIDPLLEAKNAESPSPGVASAPGDSQEQPLVIAEPFPAPPAVAHAELGSPTPDGSQAEQGSPTPDGTFETETGKPLTEPSPTPSDSPVSAGATAANESAKQIPSHYKSGHSLDSKTKHAKHAAQPPAQPQGHPNGFWQNIRKFFPGH
jgi:serine/threonine protein kinase